MGRSLLSKILGVVVVATVLVAGTLVALLVPERLEAIDRVQLSKAVSLAKQSSSHLGPAVALDDVELAREVIDGIKADREVTSVSLRHSDGRFLAGAAGQVAPDPIPGRIRVLRRPSELVVVAWVASREGPTGVLELRLDRSESQREKHHTVTATVAAVVMSLVIGVTVAAMVARRVASRATALTSAARDVAGGNLERRIEVSAQDDELGQLERAFVAMLEGLRRARDERERTAATERERLEALVAERTRMLEAQGRELRLILDNVEEALFVIEPGGTLGPECSKKSDEWFGSWREGLTLGGHLGGESARSRAWIDLAWEQVAEGFVPRDLALTQLPQEGRS